MRPELLDPRATPTLSVEQVAEVLSISRASAYRCVKSGAIPSLQLGRLRRVPTSALLKLLSMEPDNERVEK